MEDINSLIPTAEKKMNQSIDAFKNELKRLRTGRASLDLLDPIRVIYYGNPTPLNQVASVSMPDARSFLISPWEANLLKDIETAIVKSNIGMAPQSDGKTIRLKVPELTEERRKELVKGVKKIAEDGRVAVRMARREANDLLKNAQKNKEISEDDQKNWQTQVQDLTNKYIYEIDKISEEKEKDLLTI